MLFDEFPYSGDYLVHKNRDNLSIKSYETSPITFLLYFVSAINVLGKENKFLLEEKSTKTIIFFFLLTSFQAMKLNISIKNILFLLDSGREYSLSQWNLL